MGKYVESNLGKNEKIVKQAERNPVALVGEWIYGIVFFWVLFIPTILAILKTIAFKKVELAVTNKRLIGIVGVINTKSLDAPLNKIQNVSVKQPFFGKIFNYGNLEIETAAGTFDVTYVKNANAFKSQLMAQIEEYEQERIRQQAEEMARAVAGATKSN